MVVIFIWVTVKITMICINIFADNCVICRNSIDLTKLWIFDDKYAIIINNIGLCNKMIQKGLDNMFRLSYNPIRAEQSRAEQSRAEQSRG